MRPEELNRLLTGRRFRTHGHVGLEREDARQPDADQIVVVDEHDSQLLRHSSLKTGRTTARGARWSATVTVNRMPSPRRLSMSTVPPSLSTRSRMPCSPKCAPGESNRV